MNVDPPILAPYLIAFFLANSSTFEKGDTIVSTVKNAAKLAV